MNPTTYFTYISLLNSRRWYVKSVYVFLFSQKGYGTQRYYLFCIKMYIFMKRNRMRRPWTRNIIGKPMFIYLWFIESFQICMHWDMGFPHKKKRCLWFIHISKNSLRTRVPKHFWQSLWKFLAVHLRAMSLP